MSNINFVEKKVVSVSKINTDKRLHFFSIIIAVILLLLTAASTGVNLFFTSKFNQAVALENKLTAQLQTPENKKKETLMFLVKDRLKKINTLEKSRVSEYDNMQKLKDISSVLTVKDFLLKGSSCTLTVEADNYDRFNDFLNNLKQYNINSSSVAVTQTDLDKSKYTVELEFNFL